MNFLNIDLKKIIFFLLVIALPLLSINVEQKQNGSLWFDEPIQLMAGSVQSLFNGFSRGIRETTSLYLNLIGIKKENSGLRHQNSELLTRLESMEELRLENNRLRDLLSFKKTSKMDLVAAQIVGRDLVPDHNTLTINKGTDDGLRSGQAVITLEGVLGYVFRPTNSSAHVMLLSDRYAVVDGIVQRTRAHGIVEGRGAGGCNLKYIERTEDVRKGDLVVTGGLDNIFPKGFPIAVVEEVENKTISVSLKVELRPLVDPAKVEEVFIVTNAQQVDMEALTLTPPPSTEPTPSTALPAPVPAPAPAPAPVPARVPSPPQEGQ